MTCSKSECARASRVHKIAMSRPSRISSHRRRNPSFLRYTEPKVSKKFVSLRILSAIEPVNMIPAKSRYNLGSMSSSANSQQNDQFFRGMGSQFQTNPTVQSAFSMRDMSRDLQQAIADSKTESKQSSIQPARRSSKIKSHEDGFDNIRRRTPSSRDFHVAQNMEGHTHRFDQPSENLYLVQRRASETTRDEPWSTIGQVKHHSVRHTTTSNRTVSSEISSNAATKGSLEPVRRR